MLVKRVDVGGEGEGAGTAGIRDERLMLFRRTVPARNHVRVMRDDRSRVMQLRRLYATLREMQPDLLDGWVPYAHNIYVPRARAPRERRDPRIAR